ncbi:flagellar biosynthesis protein FliQ [Pseudomonas aeruginosa]
MTPESVMQMSEQALIVAAQIAGPFLLVILVVGLVISIFQAATQINEMTLTFIPKVVAVIVVLLIAGHFMMATLVSYTQELLHSIPGLIG